MNAIFNGKKYFLSDELYSGSRVEFCSVGQNLCFIHIIYSCCVCKDISVYKISHLFNHILCVSYIIYVLIRIRASLSEFLDSFRFRKAFYKIMF